MNDKEKPKRIVVLSTSLIRSNFADGESHWMGVYLAGSRSWELGQSLALMSLNWASLSPML